MEEWATQMQMKFQPSKTYVMTFRYRGQLPQLALMMYDEPLRQVTCARYLGVTVDSRHIWLPHMRMLVPRVNAFACRFLPTVRALRPIPQSTARQIYAMAVLPVLAYGHGIWGSASAKRGLTKLLARATRPFLLSITHAPPTTATALLHRLAALPDIISLCASHTTWLIATTPALRHSFLLPWAAQTPRAPLKGRPLRTHIYTLLDINRHILQQVAKEEPIIRSPHHTNMIRPYQCTTLPYPVHMR